MKALIVLAATLFTANAFAMPCDVSNEHYSCTSATKKYEIQLQFCGHNDTVTNSSAAIQGLEFASAQLANIWKGQKFLGAQFLAEDAEGQQRTLTLELSQKTLAGTVTEATRDMDPSPWKEVAAEKISCKVSSDE